MNNGNQQPINGNYANHPRPPQPLSIPRTFFTPPTPRLLQSVASDLKPLQMQNHSDYCQQSSQTLTLDQEKRDLGAQCAKLNHELLKKDSELEALKSNLQAELQQCNLKLAIAEEENRQLKQTNALSIGQEKDLETQCAKLSDELLKKDSELENLKANLQAELNQLSAKLEKAEEENRKLKHTNERNSHEFELKMNQMQIEKETSANSLTKLNESMAQVERDYISFINSFSLQIREENEMLEASVKGPSSVMNATNSNSVDLNAVIDQTKNHCNDETSPSSSKKKRKLK